METDLGDEALDALNAANTVQRYPWPQLLPLAPPKALHDGARALSEHLAGDRPWEGIVELRAQAQALLDHYRERRQAILQEHAVQVDAAVDWIKRRQGFERLSPDAQYEVIAPLREQAALNTDAKAIQPELAVLDSLFESRLDGPREGNGIPRRVTRKGGRYGHRRGVAAAWGQDDFHAC